MNQPLLFTDKESMRDSNGKIIRRLAALDNHHRLHNPGLAHGIANVQFTGIHPPALAFTGRQPRCAVHRRDAVL